MSRKYWSLKKILFITLVFLITTGLLFGGEKLAERLLKRNPLQRWVDSMPEVESFRLQERGQEIDIFIKLDPENVDNLKETLEPFIRQVQQVKKNKKVTEVIIENKSAGDLEEVYYKLSFALEEAKNTGEYSALYESLQSLQDEEKGDFRVYLGNNFYYIQLKKQNIAYFKVVPRYTSNLPNSLEGGRS